MGGTEKEEATGEREANVGRDRGREGTGKEGRKGRGRGREGEGNLAFTIISKIRRHMVTFLCLRYCMTCMYVL